MLCRWPLAQLLGELQRSFPRQSPNSQHMHANPPNMLIQPAHAESDPTTLSQHSSTSLLAPGQQLSAEDSHRLHAAVDGEQHSAPAEASERLQSASGNVQHNSAVSRKASRRHVLLEYVMLQGVNNSLEDAQRLLLLTRGIECKINLIEFNAHPGTRFIASSAAATQQFR